MDRETIIKLTLEGGFDPCMLADFTCNIGDIERLIKLVAEHSASVEREACAQVCEKAVASIWEYSTEEVKQTGTNVCNNLASYIRARTKE